MNHLSIITINYKAAAVTLRLVQSLCSQLGSEADLIIVDNDSGLSDRAALGAGIATSPCPVDVLYSDTNRGFSGGCNVGLRKAYAHGAVWFLLLNNDTQVPADGVRQLQQQLSDLRPGCYGIPLREHGDIHRAGGVRWLQSTLPTLSNPDVRDRIYIVGGAMVIHRDVIDACGLLDENYFLYFEDADYSQRVRRAGFPVAVLARPIIDHAVSHSTSALGTSLLLRYHMRNALRFNALHAPLAMRALIPLWVGWVSLRQIFKLLIRRNVATARAILAGVWDAVWGRWGMIDVRPVIAIECESLEDTSWGVARVVRGLLEGLSRRDDIASYRLRLYFKSRIPTLPEFPAGVVSCVRVGEAFGSFSLYYYLMLPLRLWWDRPSVTFWPNYMLPLIAPSPAMVMLTEDVLYESRNTQMPFRYRLAYRIFTGWAIRHATRLVSISDASADALRTIIPKVAQRITVNHLGMSELPRGVEPSEQRFFLYAAQGLPRRHLRETIIAFGELAVRYSDITLVAIGHDKYQPPVIKDLVAQTNRNLHRLAVRWEQRVAEEELAGLMRHAQALIYVSDMEAFGLPPLEALSCGVVPIVRDAPVHRELLGAHAIYVPSAEPHVIAAAMERALNDTALRISVRHAAQEVTSRYTWDAHADRFITAAGRLMT